MLSKSFKAAKCKTSLKLAIARMKLMKNKREVQLKQMKRDLSQLLESGQEQTARIRVEHVVREENTVAAYNFLELYCELIVARLSIVESQKSCPIDLKEAVASVVFASPRCTDVPELLDVRKQFTKKYGKEFITSALELRPDCGVGRLIIEKLSARPPNGETKIKILTTIAKEHNVKWDPAAMDEQVLKCPDDLLNGPNNFVSASKMHTESPRVQGQMHELATMVTRNDGTRSSETSGTVYTDMGAPVSMPNNPNADFGASGFAPEGEHKDPFPKDEKFSNSRNWNMEFKDVTSAAQAAAESAAMATIAARAAAALASHGKVARDSTELHVSSFDGSRIEGSRRSAGLKFKENHIDEDPVNMGHESTRHSHQVKPRMGNEMHQDFLSRAYESRPDDFGSTTRIHGSNEMQQDFLSSAYENRSDGFGSTTRTTNLSGSHMKAATSDESATMAELQKMDQLSPRSAQVDSINQNFQVKNYDEANFIGQGSLKKQSSRHGSTNFSAGPLDNQNSIADENFFAHVESINQNQQCSKIEMDDYHGLGNFRAESSGFVVSQSSVSHIDHDVIWNPNGPSYDNDEMSSTNTGHGNYQPDAEKSNFNDYPTAVFDDSDSDCDTHLELESDVSWHPSVSNFPQRTQSSSQSSSDTYLFSSNQLTSDSHVKKNSDLFVEPSEKISTETVRSQINESHATFDESDDPESESEDDKDNNTVRERMEHTNFPYDQNSSTRRGLSSLGGNETSVSSFNKNKEAQGLSTRSHAPSDESDSSVLHLQSNQVAELGILHESTKWRDPALLGNQATPKHTSSPFSGKVSSSSQEQFLSSEDEGQSHLQSLRTPSVQDAACTDKFGTLLPLRDEDSNFSNTKSINYESELGYGRLTGGFRNKGLSRPRYTGRYSGDIYPSSTEQRGYESTTSMEEQTVLSLEKTSESSEVSDRGLYGKKQHVKVHKASRGNEKTYVDSDSDDARVEPLQTAERRGHQGGMLSYRTKGSPMQSETIKSLRFSGRSEYPVISDSGLESGLSKKSSVGEGHFETVNESVVETLENVKLTSASSIKQSYSNFNGTPTTQSIISSTGPASMSSKAKYDGVSNQKPPVGVQKESMSTLNSSADSEHSSFGSRGYQGTMFSSRTSNLPSKAEMERPLSSNGRSNVVVSSDFRDESRLAKWSSLSTDSTSKPQTEPIASLSGQNPKSMQPDSSIRRQSKFAPPAGISAHEESMGSSPTSSDSEQPSKHLPETVASGVAEHPKSFSLSGKSTLRENSLKSVSHVHPKLPDYDTLAARLQSLRSDRRPR